MARQGMAWVFLLYGLAVFGWVWPGTAWFGSVRYGLGIKGFGRWPINIAHFFLMEGCQDGQKGFY